MKKIVCTVILLLVTEWVFAQNEKETLLNYSGNELIVDSIIVLGNKLTKTSIILREMSVRVGETINADSLDKIVTINWQRIYNTTLFTDVKVDVDTVSEGHIKFLVAVKERWYIVPEATLEFADRYFNVWWTQQNRDLNRAILGLTLTHKNFRGNREQLSIGGKLGYSKEISIAYFKPFIDKKQRQGVGFDAGYSQNNKIFYATDSNKLKELIVIDKRLLKQYWFSAIYSYRPAFSTTHIGRITYKHNQIDDTVLKLNPNYYSNRSQYLNYIELNYRLEINRVDNWNYPLVGTKIVGNIFTNIGFRGMDFFAYGTLEAAKYNHLVNKWYSSFIFRGKLSMPTNQPYYFSKQILGTKYEYVRGYEDYVIDGYHFALLRGNLKYELANFSIKNIRFKYLPVIPIRIYPKIFADAGYVWNPAPGNGFLSNRMLYSAGVGLDIFTAYDFKIRFEYAINHLGQKVLSLHFNAE